MKAAELCAGYNGLGLAVEHVFGAEPAWFAEYEAAPSRILAHHYPNVPNHGDMTKIDWATVEPVGIISGGTPCQDLSAAGKRAGMTEGTRSNLWVQMREAIAIIKPTYVVWENVRGAYSASAYSEMEQQEGRVGEDGNPNLRAIGRVLGDLATLGYDCQWRGLRAADVGAPHGRFRVFVLATRRAQSTNADNTGSQRPHDPAGATPARLGGHTLQGASGDAAADRDDFGGDGRREWAEQNRRGQPQDSSDPLAHTSSSALGQHPGESPTEETRSGGSHGSSDPRGERTTGDGRQTPANANGLRGERRGIDRDMVGASGTGEADSGERERDGDAADNRGTTNSGIRWGAYEPAIRRWEGVLGRPAPAPTEPTGRNGTHRLSAAFCEWMMGVPDGWIVDVPGVSRNDALKAAGNGVVVHQAIAALQDMLRGTE